MHIKDLEKIAKVIEKFGVEFYNEHKEEIDAVVKEVEKLEKEETNSHIHTKAMSPDELITQTRTIYDSELVDYNIWREGVTLYISLRYKVATDVGDVDLLYPFEHMEKPPEREMTVAEIEKELGYKVKVVGGPYDKREK